MKLSKNILILFGSYLGAFALVAMIGRLAVSLDGGSAPAGNEVLAGSELPADVQDTADTDLPVAVTPDTDNDTPTAGTGDGTETPETDGSGEPTEEPTLYFLRTVTTEDGAATNVIGVYSADGELLDALSTPVFALPASDRALLADGIEVIGDEALAALLEDFGG